MKKKCVTCDQEKDLSEFRRDRARVDGHQSSCKVCKRSYGRSAYMDRYADQVRKRNRSERDEYNRKLDELKKGKVCTKCAETDSICLEWHHLDPSQKDFGLNKQSPRNWKLVLAEVKKCILLCSNCHKKLHAGRFEIFG